MAWLTRRPQYLAGALVLGFVFLFSFFLLRPSPSTPPDAEWLAAKEQITLATAADQPPLGFYDERGEFRGFHRDLADGLAMVLGIEIRLIPMTGEEAFASMEQGQVDGVLGVPSDPALTALAFTTPYLESSLSIFVGEDDFSISSLSDLSGKIVAIESGVPPGKLQSVGAQLVTVADAKEGLQRLVAGEVAAFVGDEQMGLYARSQLSDAQIKIVGEPLAQLNYVIAVNSDEPRLISSLNYGLQALSDSGLREGAVRRWLGVEPETPAPPPTPSSLAFILLLALILLGGAGFFAWSRHLEQRLLVERKRARDLAEKMRRLLDTTSDAILTINPHDGRILEVNRQVESLTGFPRQDLVQMDLGRLLALKDQRRAMEGLQQALLYGSGGIEDLTLLRKDGTSLSVELQALVVAGDGRRAVQCTLRDVTEKKAMSRQLLERNRDLATINAIATLVSRFVDLEEVLKPVLSQVIDLLHMDAGSIFTGEEAGLSRLLAQGVDSQEEPGRDLVEEVAQSGKMQVVSDLATNPRWEGMAARRGEFASLAVIPLKAKAQLLGILTLYGRAVRSFAGEDQELLESIGNQIGVAIENSRLFSQLEKTVAALTSSQKFNESILESMTEGLLVVDAGGGVSRANRSLTQMLGYGEGEVEGRPVEEIMGGSGRLVRENLGRGIALAPREIILSRKNGGEIPVEIHVTPLPEKEGERGVLVVVRDLSAAKAMEEERRRLDRLALLGEMSAVVAHEVRNPLAGIGAGVQHLLSKMEPGDPRGESLEMILKETERVNRIIEEILIISRPVRLNLGPCNLVDILEEVLAAQEPRLKSANLKIRKYYPPQIPEILGDAMRLNQAFTNLVANAQEAMGKKGELQVVVALSEDGGEVLAEVRDTGPGIKQAELPRIFEPFYTTKPGGTGLGLAIVKRIIEEHSGRIKVDSEGGKGTTFTVTLPVKP